MKTHRRVLAIIVLFVCVILTGLLLPQSPPVVKAQGAVVNGPFLSSVVGVASFDGDVRNLPKVDVAQAGPPRVRAALSANSQTRQSLPSFDPIVQTAQSPITAPAPIQSFKGISRTAFAVNNWPPDPVGDVGPNHYIQAVNRSVGIYSKTGAPLAAFTFASFFTQTGTLCDVNIREDPVVLYDSLADRWLLSDVAFYDPFNQPFFECIAVSKTSDPIAGGWWLYGIQTDPKYLGDLPRLGLWPDAYYMSANLIQLPSTFIGARVWAFDRVSMLNGTFTSAKSVYFTISPTVTCCDNLLPSNLRGTPPPNGTPNFFMNADSASAGNTLHLWKFQVDWSNPLSSTFTGPTDIAVATYANVSALFIPQLNSPEFLVAGGDNLMMQLQYRNITGTQSLWASQTVLVTSTAAIRWYEIRNPNTAPVLYQQGTFRPDANHRWLPSLAVDQAGNMAIGYSVSNANIYPAIRYAGRLASDPLGMLTLSENSLIEGTGSQLGGYNRWGDYSAMSVDPVDDCTFWYTNMYYETTGSNWQTRIGSFRLPTCPYRYYFPFFPVNLSVSRQ